MDLYTVASLLIAFLVSWLATSLVRHFAKDSLTDLPNNRSLHVRPTPRGGGLGIVVTFLAGISLDWHLGNISTTLWSALALGGGLVAAIGLWDDYKSLPVSARLLAHAISASYAVWLLGGIWKISFGNFTAELGIGGPLLTVIGLIWLTNLYNFMDGIDGLAASEAILISTGAAGLSILVGAGEPRAFLWLAASCAGFLIVNWPPARIFMGDVGSGFLGYALGVCALSSVQDAPRLIWPWLILLGPFLMDATVTLLRRILRGQKWGQAHRTHAYQHLALRHSHRSVTLGLSVANALVILPLAYLSASLPSFGFILAFSCLLAIGLGVYVVGGGVEHSPS